MLALRKAELLGKAARQRGEAVACLEPWRALSRRLSLLCALGRVLLRP